MTDLHFSQEADGEHVEAGENQDSREHHQGAVLSHDIGRVEQLLQDQPTGNREAAEDAEHADGTEEMQRAREIFEKKADGDQVEKDAESAGDSVMRDTAFAHDVLDWNFDDRSAIP